MDFPRLNDSNFPDSQGINVYKYTNEFDYSRFDSLQMKLQLCTVPWDMGEAHIGARTISGIGNVVDFKSKTARDAWFEAIPDSDCYRFESKYKALHRDNEIIVPIPFDECSKHNYLVVDYAQFAADGSPVIYETGTGLMKWFWFVREVEFLAPNSTKLHLLPDSWQTFIYDVDIPSMMLERGHAPLFAVNATQYLKSPINNARYLLADDVVFGDPADVAASSSAFVLNDTDIMAVVVTSANPRATNWGDYDDSAFTPSGLSVRNGVPGYYAFAMAASDFQAGFAAWAASYPHFLQTVKCVFFIAAKMLVLGASFKFAGDTDYPVTCREISSTNATRDLAALDKAAFGYPAEYAELAKLYTYPYSVLEIYGSDGSIEQIRIERTDGTLQVETALNLAYPWIRCDMHLLGVGRAPASTLTFSNLSARTIGMKGNWLDTLITLEIPTFGVLQAAYDYDGYSNLYERKQAVVAYTNEYDSSVASANASKANADDSADNDIANMALTTTNNSAIVALANAKASDDADQNILYNRDSNAASELLNIGANIISAQAAQQTANLSATQGIVNGFLSGDIGAAISGIVNSGFTQQSAAITIAANQTQTGLTNGYNGSVNQATNSNISIMLGYSQQLATNKNTATNTMLTAQTANSAATAKGNATRDQTTAIANAARTRSTAQNAIMHGRSNAGVAAPLEFGTFENGEHATTRPNGIWCVVKTQDMGAIVQTGDYWLRYGYAYNGNWAFDGDWTLDRKYCYWKLADFWVKGLNIPDMYMDGLRFLLFGGVTVWADPSDIGNTTIYDLGV